MRAIVLLSGGIDSTVALAEAIEVGRECSCMFFDYQQRAFINEWTASRAVASYYGRPVASCHIDGLFWAGTSFLTGGTDCKQSIVPARNLLLLAHGIAAADARGAAEVWIGCNLDDAADYPDCTAPFVDAVSRAASYATSGVVVRAPHLHRNKAEVIRRGLELCAPLHITTSCADVSGHCGVCKACVLRREAYADLGLADNV